MSNEFKDKSDFEINEAIAELKCFNLCEGQHYKPSVSHWNGFCEKFNPCNNPSDAYPIILENKISVEYDQSCDVWIAHQGDYLMGKYVSACKYRHQHEDKNPLRAAMIVYLMANEVTNKCQ